MGYDADHALAHGEVGKCGAPDLFARRHGDAVRRHSARQSLGLDDHQLAGRGDLGHVPRGGGEAGREPRRRFPARCRTTSSRNTSRRRSTSFRRGPPCGWSPTPSSSPRKQTPRFNPISISGYHIREAGSTALQELAFTLRDGLEYVDWALERGLAIDDFAPRLSFFFNAHNDFFEEIAKYRAARKLWALLMRDRYGARDERSLKLRFHAQTAGCSLTWQQPYNNVVRTSLQAMAAVLGGAQSLHTNSLDEAWALPSEHAATLALRTQQVIAFESGVTAVPDPFGGSDYLERLTLDLESGARDYIRRIDDMGGMIAAIERGFPQARNRPRQLRVSAEDRAGRSRHCGRQPLPGRGRRTH